MKNPDVEIASLAKNANEALILAILARGDSHGYKIAVEIEERSNGMFTFNHGTLYPILHKLEKEGLIKSIWKSGETKRKRKYYTLTPAGKTYWSQLRIGWQEFMDRFSEIIGRK